LSINSGAFAVSAAGAITAATGITTSGAITFSGLSSAGVVHADASGVLSTGAVALGTDTTGDYVSALGSLTGLSATGNSGVGSTPTLSVTYGSAISTAAQGNTSLSFSGSANLTGTVSGTAGGGFSANTLAIINNPTFSGLLTASGWPVGRWRKQQRQLQPNRHRDIRVPAAALSPSTATPPLPGSIR